MKGPSKYVVTTLLVGAVSLPAEAQQPSRTPPVDWLRPCQVAVGGDTADGWCGSYAVWENRAAQTGRRIPLKVVVLPARQEPREPDPVVWLRGGPGGAATASIRGIAQALGQSWQRRDLLFVDRRGTGSSHPLDCPPRPEDEPLQTYFEPFLQPHFVRACLAAQDADVTQYTTPIAMDDLNEIRAALGYEKINIFGRSYGTRAGLIYLRRHPETVRAAVLKGVAPTNMRNPLPFARALEWGLDGVFEACAADEACAAEYPDLEADWNGVVDRFAAGPVTATVRHEGRVEEVTVSKGGFADGIRHILYSVGASRGLPRLIRDAARGDFNRFAQAELEQMMGLGEALSIGMFLTVTCSEDLRFVTEDEIRRETGGTFLGDYRVRLQLAACEIWGRGEIPDDYTAPVTAVVPTLLISGEFDTATPVDGATWVAEHLPNATHLIVPNESHGFRNPRCELGVINRFIANGGPDGLDADCIYETVRPPFVLGEGDRPR